MSRRNKQVEPEKTTEQIFAEGIATLNTEFLIAEINRRGFDVCGSGYINRIQQRVAQLETKPTPLAEAIAQYEEALNGDSQTAGMVICDVHIDYDCDETGMPGDNVEVVVLFEPRLKKPVIGDAATK